MRYMCPTMIVILTRRATRMVCYDINNCFLKTSSYDWPICVLTDTAPCLRRDSNPRPFGWESDVLTIRPWTTECIIWKLASSPTISIWNFDLILELDPFIVSFSLSSLLFWSTLISDFQQYKVLRVLWPPSEFLGLKFAYFWQFYANL
jgi:hypothetical protein